MDKMLIVEDTAVSTSRIEILEWVQQFPMQIPVFLKFQSGSP